MSRILSFLLIDLPARLPLWLLHRIGTIIGWIIYSVSKQYAQRIQENLRRAFPKINSNKYNELLNSVVSESGKSITELPWIWRRPAAQVLGTVRHCYGWELLEAAQAKGKGVIVLLPHMGCFEVVAMYVGARIPSVCMYRVPKLAWLDKVMRAGRERGLMKLARADLGGVRMIFKALKRNEAVGILPDQVPSKGEGEWANFFGRPAYTMLLINRLVEASGATVLKCYGERLPNGDGYDIHFSPLELNLQSPITRQINTALEEVIECAPSQYLWSYNRYKTPRGVTPPNND
ncbi:MAG: lysophospholipid acyltransferase family protein [Gallionellaceae bacterium]|jgi:KDO2-lipid IV(A) lauroyltransferase